MNSTYCEATKRWSPSSMTQDRRLRGRLLHTENDRDSASPGTRLSRERAMIVTPITHDQRLQRTAEDEAGPRGDHVQAQFLPGA